ncbi:hypothetical protein DH2020_009146 [Rehmannia glutinosa]|uniref:Uncharacterized protein n=1 Tax=Rehmannia glutinosa TaxID=99300 RepID=A0ABR0X5G4_REHGL
MKSAMQNSLSYCANEKKPCIDWAEKYFKDCLCNIKDELSFGFGLISLVCWGVAEIPQIITNFRTKSGHGVSLAFLLTWIAGDIFNLVGCLLEPATLPTQYYTAVADDMKKPLRPQRPIESAIPIPSGTRRRSETYYYTSARSLAGSTTPPIRSYLWPIKSGPSAVGVENDSSSDDEANPISARNTVSKPRPIPRSAGYGAFLATTINMPRETKALMQAYVGLTGRKLLQEHGSESVYGQLLGWMMAAIYMGGRLPQIWLNIKRGNVEGLNPLMFIFALVANATYVASILVRSIAWDKIKANMPWLLDAVYVYYRYLRKESRSRKEGYADYMEEKQ